MNKMKNIKEIIKEVYGELGYSISRLSEDDFLKIREFVKNHYLDILKNVAKVDNQEIIQSGMDEYHNYSDSIEHDKIWTKRNRILSNEIFKEFLKLDLFKEIKNEIGEVFISDEENIGYPEIYWRLVRPFPHNDVGPIHADAWFWELGHGETPVTHERVKFWFALFNESGENGFCYVPSSHRIKYDYNSEHRNGFVKPTFNPSNYDLNIQVFNSTPGDFIIFNDRLLHGGKVGGVKTRVSLEFTLFVPKTYLQKQL
jgi:hypothetical protein